MHQFLKSHFTEADQTSLVGGVLRGQGVSGSLVEGDGERETSVQSLLTKITVLKAYN